MNIIQEIKNELKVFDNILFDKKSHTYTLLGDHPIKAQISMTSLIHKYVNEFNTQEQAKRYSEKHKIPIEDVLAKWKFEGDYASRKGTAIHNYLENKFSNKPDFMYDIKEIEDYFGKDVLAEAWVKLKDLAIMFYEQMHEFIIPIACELKVFDKKTKVAGAIDMLAYHIKSKQLIIIDYKSSKNIFKRTLYNEYMLNPLSHLPDINYYHYSLQLNGYKYIIEKNTKLHLAKQHYIIWINEKNDEPIIIPTLNLYKEAKLIIDAEKYNS